MHSSTTGSAHLSGQAVDVLETLPDGFLALTRDWKLAYANGHAQRLFDSGHGQPGEDIWQAGLRLHTDAFEAACRQAMQARTAAELTVHDPVHGGWHEIRIAPAEPGLFVHVRDVTASVAMTRALRESERDFRLLADSIPQIVWIVEASGRAVFFNRQWRDYTGVHIDASTPADIASEFVHADDRATTDRDWKTAYESGGAFRTEHRIRAKDGQYRWFLVLAEPWRNAAGELERWFGTSTDIHEQKMAKLALTESELRFRALVNATSDVIYRMSPDWKYMHQLDGRGFLKTTSGLGEYPIEEYVYPDDLALAQDAIAAAIAGKSIFALEHRVLRVDGSHGWTYSRAVPILDDDGAIREWIGMASDITVRKLIEEQLTEASNRKDEFLAMLAHELRNPLAPVKAAAQLLQLRPLNEERVLHTSQIIARQVAHMTNLVDELLDVSRVSKNLITLDRAVLDMRDVIGDAVEQVTPLIQSLEHRLEIAPCPHPIQVDGDEKRLVQILANLLSNAAKYTPRGGTIRVDCRVVGDEVVVDVIDNGIGMTPETLRVAFDLFSQAERSSDRSSGGLGLGLALVKSLVGLHGGTANCASEGLGRGSTFTVRLPLLRETGRPDAPAPDQAWVPAPGLRILVVDDNEDAAATLAMLLEAMGHEVAVEHTPAAALDHAAIEAPQVCLLDIGLPGMDGNELAQRLRARPGMAGVVLVAVTGYGQESDRARSMAAGFDFHLVKPVDIDKLGQILSEAAH